MFCHIPAGASLLATQEQKCGGSDVARFKEGAAIPNAGQFLTFLKKFRTFSTILSSQWSEGLTMRCKRVCKRSNSLDCSVLLRSNCSVQPGVKILDTNSSLQLQSGNSVAGIVALWHCVCDVCYRDACENANYLTPSRNYPRFVGDWKLTRTFVHHS